MMGLGDAYQDSTDRTLAVMASAPLEPEKPKPKYSAWSAIPRAVAGAFAETAGNLLDTASAYGQVAAAAGGLGPGFDPDVQKNRAKTLEAYDRLKTEGIDWRPEISRPQYEFARDLRPDPLTAGVAENIVFSVTKGLTKAIGAGTVLGPAGGAVAFGASEGMTTAEDLADQGVDQATRTQVGAVTAALNTAGMALPVAGKTIAGTVGLAVTGGPASFIAQQQATRSILEAADYGEIAQQYDPLDPVGLAVSTLLPLGFGAWVMRGSFRGAKAQKPADGTIPARAAESATATPETMPAPTQEQLDAAMVQNLTALHDIEEAGRSTTILAEPPKFIQPIQITAPIFKKSGVIDAQATEAMLPAVQGGFVRLYRAESSSMGFDDVFHSDGLSAHAPGDMQGKFYTTDLSYADYYRSSYGKNATIHYIDVPSEALASREISPGEYVVDVSAIQQTATVKTDDQTQGGHVAALVDRVEAMRQSAPDMPVALREDGTPATIAEELDAIRRQVQEGTDTELGAMDADLLRVAAECALATGTA